ncbi:MAG: hypothetical protein R2712_21305 [Vicinamibacterales bacterium]
MDAEAGEEARTLARYGCLAANTVLVHGVGLCAAWRARVLDAGAGLVWCPSSNQYLFGSTADVRAFDDADRLAIGSDSRLSADGDLLDELRAAHETRQIGHEGLIRAVTGGPARLLRLAEEAACGPGVRRTSPSSAEGAATRSIGCRRRTARTCAS